MMRGPAPSGNGRGPIRVPSASPGLRMPPRAPTATPDRGQPSAPAATAWAKQTWGAPGVGASRGQGVHSSNSGASGNSSQHRSSTPISSASSAAHHSPAPSERQPRSPSSPAAWGAPHQRQGDAARGPASRGQVSTPPRMGAHPAMARPGAAGPGSPPPERPPHRQWVGREPARGRPGLALVLHRGRGLPIPRRRPPARPRARLAPATRAPPWTAPGASGRRPRALRPPARQRRAQQPLPAVRGPLPLPPPPLGHAYGGQQVAKGGPGRTPQGTMLPSLEAVLQFEEHMEGDMYHPGAQQQNGGARGVPQEGPEGGAREKGQGMGGAGLTLGNPHHQQHHHEHAPHLGHTGHTGHQGHPGQVKAEVGYDESPSGSYSGMGERCVSSPSASSHGPSPPLCPELSPPCRHPRGRPSLLRWPRRSPPGVW